MPSPNLGDSQNGKRRRRKPGENRERLLEAGTREFGTHGYHGASTSAIGALAGVPQPHLYANFRTKKDLFLACASRSVEHLIYAESRGTSEVGEHSAHLLYARMIFQAHAAVAETDLRAPIVELLQQLQGSLGEDAINALLVEAATSMIRTGSSGL